MYIQENVKLADLTTFGTGGIARYFVNIETQADLLEALDFAKTKNIQSFIIAGGSNIVFSDNDYDGMIIRINLKGLELVGQMLHAAAGEEWDDVVQFAVDNNLWGMENLSSIPGLTGSVAVQNVGAYGQEAANIIDTVTVYDRQTGEIKDVAKSDCSFSYRSSIFNSTERGHYIILKIIFKLSTTPAPRIDYPEVIKYFSTKQITDPSLQQIRDAIVAIRAVKFSQTTDGKAGSFFKNLYLSPAEYNKMLEIIQAKKPELVTELEVIKNKFPTHDGHIKIPTAWVIDKVCNLKGKKIGSAQISETQALAILNINHQAKSADVKTLIDLVVSSVYEYTGKKPDVEPELVGF